MLFQFPTDAVGIALLIVAIVLLFIFNYLAVRWIESKELARRKKVSCFFVALLGVLMFIIVLWVWGLIFSQIDGWTNNPHWPNAQPLIALGPMIVFLIYIVLVHWLIGADWKSSTWIAILALLLLASLLAFIPYAAEYLRFYPIT